MYKHLNQTDETVMKFFNMLLAGAFLFAMTACEEDGAPPPQEPAPQDPPTQGISISDLNVSSVSGILDATAVLRDAWSE